MLKLTNSQLHTDDGKLLLSSINFHVKKGMIYFLKGANGIGKTTLIKSILEIDSKITNISKSFEDFFYLPQIENKEFLLPISLSNVSKDGFLLSREERDTLWNNASGGQRKKALLERAFASDAELLILDEPFNHLDSKSIEKVISRFENKLNEDKAVIVVSHKPMSFKDGISEIVDVEKWK